MLLNDQLNAVGVAWRLLAAAIFLTLASVVLFHMMRGGSSRTWLQLLVIWSIGFWIIRGGGILIDSQRTLGFKTVHTVLMFGTFALAAMSVSGKRD
ncbi:MAG: hypothetical protein CNE88_04440 [Acidimicrobiales bacterium MED-G01]|nr:MAG: hypothetical protein CNE88_04440 [Acidimicrobiales bacterium MED-G01]